MADQGQWFKLWIGADDDPDLGNLSLEDFGRWCKLGLYIKKHGTDGQVLLQWPALALQQKFRSPDYKSMVTTLYQLPNIILSTTEIYWPHGIHRPPECNGKILRGTWFAGGRGEKSRRVAVATPLEDAVAETVAAVSINVCWRNWMKYQGDFSTSRVHKYREMKRSRGEETRGDKTRGDESNPPKGSMRDKIESHVDELWKAWPPIRRKSKGGLRKALKRLSPSPELFKRMLAKVEQLKKSSGWQKDGGQFIPYPGTWVNAEGWEDEIDDFLGVSKQKMMPD